VDNTGAIHCKFLKLCVIIDTSNLELIEDQLNACGIIVFVLKYISMTKTSNICIPDARHSSKACDLYSGCSLFELPWG
jgi:hypothetical protein